MPPVEAALVVTYVQFPIQVCFPCIGQPVTDSASVTDNLVVLILVMMYVCVDVKLGGSPYRTSSGHSPLARLLAVVVCLCVYLPQVTVLLKWRNVGSHKQRHTIVQEL